MVQTVDVAEPRDLSLEEQQAAVRQRVADRQRQYGFAVTEPAEIYRSPQADRPDEVIQLGDDSVQVLDDQQQADWARNTISRNLGAHQAAAARAAPPPPVAVPASPIGDLRAGLAQAIGEASQAAQMAAEADAAVTHATEAMAEADTALGEFAELDERISRYTIDALRAKRPTGLPPELLTAQRLRAEAIDSSRNLHIAYGTLTAEAQQARVQADRLAAARNVAASNVLRAHADMLAQQLAELESQVLTLRQQIRSTGDCWLVFGVGDSRSIGLSNFARETLLKVRDATPQLDPDYCRALVEWYDTLKSEPNAELQL